MKAENFEQSRIFHRNQSNRIIVSHFILLIVSARHRCGIARLPQNHGMPSSGPLAALAVASILLLYLWAWCLHLRLRRASPTRAERCDEEVVDVDGARVEIGSHNIITIDVHRCASGACSVCGEVVKSPIKFVPAKEDGDTDTTDMERGDISSNSGDSGSEQDPINQSAAAL